MTGDELAHEVKNVVMWQSSKLIGSGVGIVVRRRTGGSVVITTWGQVLNSVRRHIHDQVRRDTYGR